MKQIMDILFPESIEQRLRLYMWIATILLGAFVIRLMNYTLDTTSYFPTSDSLLAPTNWKHFVQDKGLYALLASVVFLVYFDFRRNSQKEIEIMAAMFSPYRTPQRWDRVEAGHQLIWLTATWLIITLALLWTVDRPIIFSMVVMIYTAANVVSMIMYRKNIARFLSDDRYFPTREDEHRQFILQRRQIQSVYLNKHHNLKEAMMFAGAGAPGAAILRGVLNAIANESVFIQRFLN